MMLTHHSSGLRSPNMVGNSSDTVGCIWTARCITVRGFRVHEVQDRVDDFVSPHTQDRCAEELLGLGVDQDFHEALRLAFLEGSTDVLHCHLGDQHFFA